MIPTYFLYFFVDFFFSSRTSFWTRFNIGCEQMVRSIMLFAGWVTLLFTLGFLTLDFLGAIFFWYFSLRKKIQKYQDNLREIKCWYDVYEHHILDKTIRRRHA